MNDAYSNFLASKAATATPVGITPTEPNPILFQFQRDIVKWALRRGRAAIWADCGLGKTFMQLEWAKQIPGDVLILAPLAVAQQTIEEGVKLGIVVRYCRHANEVKPGVTIANYEVLEHFDCSRFKGVVLDESSILKAFMGKTKRAILAAFVNTQFKLACTATPAPNDHMELGNHAEFCGVMQSNEMLAKFFTNDAAHVGRYRLKGHSEKPFWRWMAAWAVMIGKPSDLGYSDVGFELPEKRTEWLVVNTTKPADGLLFALPAASLSERISARRNSVEERVAMAAEKANSNGEQWLVWCALNSESALLAEAIEGAVEVVGADSVESKSDAMRRFIFGEIRVLVSKPSICGFGMNFQHCRNAIFVGLSDSWEEYYQAVRRIWRFGQNRLVNIVVITAATENAVVSNILRKETAAIEMGAQMAKEISYISRQEIQAQTPFRVNYVPTAQLKLPSFLCQTLTIKS